VAGISNTVRGGVISCLFAGELNGASNNIGVATGSSQNDAYSTINGMYFYNSNGVTPTYSLNSISVSLTELTSTTAAALNARLDNAASYLDISVSAYTRADLIEWVQDYASPNYPVFVDGIVRDVTVNPPSASVVQGGTQQLTATVVGNLAAASKAVSWTSTGGANVSASSTGLVTVSASAAPGAYTVRATSAVDSAKFADVVITVTAAGPTDAQSVAAAKAALTWAVIRNANTLQSEVTTNLTLGTAGAEETAISWASNNIAVISTAGVVTRPAYTAGDANVRLTATITKGSASDTVQFDLTVLKNLQTDAEAVAEAKAALSWDTIRNANTLQTAVTTNLTLSTAGAGGTSISWGSNNVGVISAAGVVTRPPSTAADANVTLTATITKGTASDTVVFNLTVLKEAAVTSITGSGTKADPYIIATAENFKEFTDNMIAGNEYNRRYFRQTAHIDMAGYPGYNGLDERYYFCGYYDGGGYKINVSISSSGNNCIFPNLGRAGLNTEPVIINLGTTGSITGGTYAAGIALGMGNGYGTVINCWSTATVTADPVSGNAAGLVMAINAGLRNSYYAGSLSGSTIGAAIGIAGETGLAPVRVYFYNANNATINYQRGINIRTEEALKTSCVLELNTGRDSSASFIGDFAFDRVDLKEWCQDYQAPNYPVFVDGIVRRVDVTPPSATVRQGEQQQLSAEVLGNLPATTVRTVTWTSSSPNVTVSAGLVTVSSSASPDVYTITATSVADSTVYGIAQITVTAAQSDAEAVAEAKAALTWDVIRNANTLQSAVTTNLTLITSGLAGTSISWQSSNPSVVSVPGIVTRPSFTAGDAGVTLTATISRGGSSDYVTFNLTVTKLPKSNAEAVAEAKAALTWDIIRNANIEQTSVTTNLNLITSFIEDTQVNWTTDNSLVITTGGVVTRPAYTASDANVKLTAQIRRIDAIDYVVFDLTVLKNVQTDAEAVAEAKALLTWDVIRGANTWQTAVTTNLNLITSGSSGTTVSWASDNTAVVSELGVVVRQAADASVRIVATITKGASNDQVVFDLTVPKLSDIIGIGVVDFVITPVGTSGFNAAATVVNNTETAAPDISLLIAAYDQAGRMVAMSIKIVPISAKSSEQISLDLFVVGKDVFVVKAFVWNDYIPICPNAALFL